MYENLLHLAGNHANEVLNELKLLAELIIPTDLIYSSSVHCCVSKVIVVL